MTSRVATHVAAGEYFTLINTKEGVIYGMGSGGNGNLGVQPGGSNDISSPVRVNVNSEVGTARAIAAGYQHSVAILELYKL
jgi:alpha-tubulin suppressor-like RCC1 family protein